MLTQAEVRARRDAKIIILQDKLLDHTGHVRRELTVSAARRLLRSLNQFRRESGLDPLDMTGRW